MIRHGEKPEIQGDVRLTVSGQARAQAYTIYFQHYLLADARSITLSHLFAAADSDTSHRSRLTIEPLGQALGLPIDATYADADFQELADVLLRDPRYDDGTTLICWHHERLLPLAVALGVRSHALSRRARWPDVWPAEVYGWVLQLCYDEDGSLVPAQTCCRNQQLMYGDHGQDPPTTSWSMQDGYLRTTDVLIFQCRQMVGM
jgi:hypothetical protein